MKIKEGYLLDAIGKQKVAIALDWMGDKSAGMIKLNDAGAFLWEKLEKETSEQELVQAMMEEYDVEEEQAKKDVHKYIDMLRKQKILEN